MLCSVIVLIISFFSFSAFSPNEPLWNCVLFVRVNDSVGENLKDNPTLVLEVISREMSLVSEYVSW